MAPGMTIISILHIWVTLRWTDYTPLHTLPILGQMLSINNSSSCGLIANRWHEVLHFSTGGWEEVPFYEWIFEWFLISGILPGILSYIDLLRTELPYLSSPHLTSSRWRHSTEICVDGVSLYLLAAHRNLCEGANWLRTINLWCDW